MITSEQQNERCRTYWARRFPGDQSRYPIVGGGAPVIGRYRIAVGRHALAVQRHAHTSGRIASRIARWRVVRAYAKLRRARAEIDVLYQAAQDKGAAARLVQAAAAGGDAGELSRAERAYAAVRAVWLAARR